MDYGEKFLKRITSRIAPALKENKVKKCKASQNSFLQKYKITFKNMATVSDLEINGYELAINTGLWPDEKIIKVEQI